MSKNILIVFGTRPEVIKLAPVILALKSSPLKNKFVLVCTSQQEDLLAEQLAYWNIHPDFYLPTVPPKTDLTRLLIQTLSGLQDIVDKFRSFDYLIVQGDTNTALACSNLAVLNKIKLVHIEAGLRSFDFDHPFPEEYNRKVASLSAYLHFAPTENAKTNLLKELVDPSKIIVTGNTVVDALRLSNKTRLDASANRSTVLITFHRRENIFCNLKLLAEIVFDLAKQYPHMNFIWITHPNCVKEVQAIVPLNENVRVVDHMPYPDFVQLYDRVNLVITDSGGVTEEAVHLGLPVIVFRKKSERVEAIDDNYPMIISIDKNLVMDFFNQQVNASNNVNFSYGDGNASQIIVDALCKEMRRDVYDVIIVGGGPAGTGLLLKALKDLNYRPLLNKRIAVIEMSGELLKGNLCNFQVNSDTLSDVFLECLDGATSDFIDKAELESEIAYLKSFSGRSIPLCDLDGYLTKLGTLLKEGLEKNDQCDFFLNTKVDKIVRRQSGVFDVYASNFNEPLRAAKVVMAGGGLPHYNNDEKLKFAENVLLSDFRGKCVHSDYLLKSKVADHFKSDLLNHPKVVILGGGHSGFSVAHNLLSQNGGDDYKAGDIVIWSHNAPKVYFNNKEEALEAGYHDFTVDDVCPVTNKLYRLAGLRMDGRSLFMNMLGLNNVKKEERVKIKFYDNSNNEIADDLANASMIVLAYGYKLNMCKVFDCAGNEINFEGEKTNHWVNNNCELLDDKGRVIPGLFAMGLATGFVPSGDLGGEPSFEGQTNGIWYYQNALAGRILDNL